MYYTRILFDLSQLLGAECGIKNSAKNLERWFEGIQISIRSDQTVSSTEIACGVDKPLNNHLETRMKQEVGSPYL
ncbi:hypothetical protein [Cylindrospermopsis raciborskii]|uniref:hypothetical protein n=1 Tax=Cylindrospermopsis raciborskii TaxID=77022 RepID=UPI0015E0FF67|nr:hypothetical protein [Cylindrospermopsis raciborskii]